MAKLHLQVVTAERVTYDGEADIVVAPGSEGEFGILPMHAPLLAKLKVGTLRARNGDEEVVMALGLVMARATVPKCHSMGLRRSRVERDHVGTTTAEHWRRIHGPLIGERGDVLSLPVVHGPRRSVAG